MKHKYLTCILSIIILLNPVISAGIETGIIRGNAKEEEIESVISGLNLLGRDAVEIRFPEISKAVDIEEAKLHLSKGIEFYNYMKFDSAENHLKKAINLFYEGLAYPGVREELENALFYLGALQIIRGKESNAQRTFSALIELNENFEPDFKKFPPKIIEKYKIVKNKHKSPPEYDAYICSPYPELTIDGLITVKPQTLIKLKRGKHTIVNENEKFFSSITINGNSSIYAGRIESGALSGLPGSENSEVVQRIRNLCGMKEIIYVENSGAGLVTKNYSLNKQSDIQIENGSYEPELKRPFYKKWWFWTGIGVIAGSGVSIYMLTNRTGDKNDSSSVVVKW